jgi:hypothetical protein
MVVGGVRTHIGLAVLGAWIAGFGAVMLTLRHLRDRGDAGRGPRGRTEASSLDGVPATVLRDHPAFALLTAGVMLYTNLLFLLPLLAWDHLDVGLRVLCAVSAAPLLVLALRYAHWARDAGVWLTRSEVVMQGWDQVRRMRSDEVRLVSVGRVARPPVVLLAGDRATAVQVSGRRRLYPGLELPGHIAVVTPFLPLDAESLERVLRTLADGSRTSVLGTSAGPGLIRSIADGTA